MSEEAQLSAALTAEQWDEVAKLLLEQVNDAQKNFTKYNPILNSLRTQLQPRPPAQQPQNGSAVAGAPPPSASVPAKPG